ncbi:MAG: hypothetical protein ACK5R4_06870 [Alphaproteobacteria bacterium]
MTENKNPITPQHIATAQAFVPQSAVYDPSGDAAALIPAQYSRGSYRVVYTASTGCGGATGVIGRHNLVNLQKLSEKVPVDYINTNFQSDKEWLGAAIPLDSQGKPVPGNKIAHVAQAGNDKTGGSQLGMDLLKHYNLSAFGKDVVLVFVTDTNNRRTDRVVERFDSTFGNSLMENVLNAVKKDQAQKQPPTPAKRSI